MLDLDNLRLLHPHGDESIPMRETGGHHDPAAHEEAVVVEARAGEPPSVKAG